MLYRIKELYLNFLIELSKSFYIKIKCPVCGKKSDTVRERRRMTVYCEELDHCNYLIACGKCQERDDEYYRERWEEYYSGLL